jgi:hypothetical protein
VLVITGFETPKNKESERQGEAGADGKAKLRILRIASTSANTGLN